MTSKIIVAIVAIAAAVLSLAAPVAVEAQSPSLTVDENLIGRRSINYSGFSVGSTYYSGYCHGVSSSPATCTYSSFPLGVLTANCNENFSWTIGAGEASGDFGSQYGLPSSGQIAAPYVRWAAYSDSTCSTEVTAVTFTMNTSLPTWRVRDITDDSATIYIEDAFSTHKVLVWTFDLTPGGRTGTVDPDYSLPLENRRTPIHALRGLSPGTPYTYDITPGYGNPIATVTFTTTGNPDSGPSGPPPPEPPTGVEGGEPTTDVNGGSVTISWANPGDPDIATYEYSLRQAGGPVGEWTTIPGSNADTTSVTIDLATGEARVVNNATPPMGEWTIHLRARDTNGNAGGIFTTTVNAAAAGPGTVVPALPLAGLVTLALVLFLGGQRQRKGG